MSPLRGCVGIIVMDVVPIIMPPSIIMSPLRGCVGIIVMDIVPIIISPLRGCSSVIGWISFYNITFYNNVIPSGLMLNTNGYIL